MNYYNEWDAPTAAWLRELIANKLIPRGVVDERSIVEVEKQDLTGFTQCHFFAGIGGWAYALQLAGIPSTERLWTGSPPCQPFSSAGKQLGQFDPRHLAPVFLRLVGECRPPILFGEQVAAAIGKSWMCDLQARLENEDYAVGFAVLPACGVGAPHKRDRLFFGASSLAYAERIGNDEQCKFDVLGRQEDNPEQIRLGRESVGVAHPIGNRPQRRVPGREGTQRETERRPPGCSGATDDADAYHGGWVRVDWLGCRDGKFRAVEPGAFPLADGLPARVGRLRGYGNAIVPQIASKFIRAFLDSTRETFKG